MPINKLLGWLNFRRVIRLKNISDRFKVMIFGTIAGIFTALILRKLYLRKKQERIERNLRETMENVRRQRRQQQRPNPNELRRDEKCVVCVQNPKEVISIGDRIDCIAT